MTGVIGQRLVGFSTQYDLLMKEYNEYIHIDPRIMLGKPVIKGTRITVELIQEELQSGKSTPDILEAFPHLNIDQIRAVQALVKNS